jgi:hypothetical protein
MRVTIKWEKWLDLPVDSKEGVFECTMSGGHLVNQRSL